MVEKTERLGCGAQTPVGKFELSTRFCIELILTSDMEKKLKKGYLMVTDCWESKEISLLSKYEKISVCS